MSTKNLIVSVDVQNDFISGPLGSSWAVEVAEKIDKFLKDTADADRKVIGIFDTHSQATYLDTREGRLLPVCHCVSGSEGWMSPVMDQYDVHVCKCEFRPPEQRYVTEVYNCTEGGLVDDEYFCGDSFLGLCEPISKKEYNKLVSDIA